MNALGASLVGREHVRLGRNNQDGWAIAGRDGVVVGVVADGCSSQPRSEVGALLGARFLAEWVANSRCSRSERVRGSASSGAEPSAFESEATDALTAFIYRAAREIDPRPEALETVLETYFLFTFLCVVAWPERAIVFGIGDGAVLVDGEVLRLDPGPDNAPPYCAYRLTSSRRPEPQVHFVGEAKRIAIMSDGLEPLVSRPQLGAALDDALRSGNPLTLQRRLNVLGETAKLSDDATLVVVGRA